MEVAWNALTFGPRVTIGAIENVMHAIRSRSDPPSENFYLTGVYKPQPQEIDASGNELEVVQGAIPKDVEGAFVRNGPNAVRPPKSGYHLFDGDGMIHDLRLKNGEAFYSNRFVRTKRYQETIKNGSFDGLNLGDMSGITGMVKCQLRSWKNKLGVKTPNGTANTALAYHNGALLALNEADMPYALRVLCNAAVETLCQVDSYGGAVTAHPKIDPETGEMFYFKYSIMPNTPNLTIMRADKEGKMIHSFDVKLRCPAMIHDCALTERHFIILDTPLCFAPELMIKQPGCLPFQLKTEIGTRVGVMPRNAKDESDITWFDFSGCQIFHTLAAWDEGPDGSKVRLFFSRLGQFDFTMPSKDGDNSTVDAGSPTPWEYFMDLKTGEGSERCIMPLDLPLLKEKTGGPVTGMDFPQVHPLAWAKGPQMQKYGYMSVFRGLDIIGVIKVDLQAAAAAKGTPEEVGKKCFVGYSPLPEGACGGEFVLCPRGSEPSRGGSMLNSLSRSTANAPAPSGNGFDIKKLDDGYLATMYSQRDPTTGEYKDSYFTLIDAKTMGKPTVTLKLPHFVPYGFHAAWLNRNQLAHQNDEVSN